MDGLNKFFNIFGQGGISMITKVMNVTDKTTSSGDPYKLMKFENGLLASAFDEALFEHCVEGSEVDVTMVQKGQYKNIVKILPVIQEGSQEPIGKDDNENLGEEAKVLRKMQSEDIISKKMEEDRKKREPSDIHIIRESSVKSAAPIFAEMIKIDGMKEIGSEDLIIIAKRIESYIKTGV